MKKLRSQIQMELEIMQNDGATASEALVHLINHLRKERCLKETLETAGLSKNVGRRFASGEGSITLVAAELLCRACGYKLVMEVDE